MQAPGERAEVTAFCVCMRVSGAQAVCLHKPQARSRNFVALREAEAQALRNKREGVRGMAIKPEIPKKKQAKQQVVRVDTRDLKAKKDPKGGAQKKEIDDGNRRARATGRP
jgi:hypothetical protein